MKTLKLGPQGTFTFNYGTGTDDEYDGDTGGRLRTNMLVLRRVICILPGFVSVFLSVVSGKGQNRNLPGIFSKEAEAAIILNQKKQGKIQKMWEGTKRGKLL